MQHCFVSIQQFTLVVFRCEKKVSDLMVFSFQVLQIIPESMFGVLHEIITILTNEMKEVMSHDQPLYGLV